METRSDDLAEELRRLILGPKQEQIEDLQQRLDDPHKHAEDISNALSEAVLISAKKDDRLSRALMPTVENIIRNSIKKDINSFADAIFPVMGPAIRKSIAETFKQMVQSLNTALDHSFSLQGIKWRMEAARTGRSFAEVVILNSLVFRVEQVFLIHRDSGSLLQHVTSVELESFQDADLVSAMLTAIRDFVRDSFQEDSERSLDTIQIGELSLWIEQGPQAIIACAIRGTAPESFRFTLRESLENIHRDASELLDDYQGESDPFEAVYHHLESCIQAKYLEQEKKLSPALIISLLIVLFAGGAWIYITVSEQNKLDAYVHLLELEPGIIVTTVDKQDGKYFISGLRDPMAVEPDSLVRQSGLNTEQIVTRMELYASMDEHFILQRAKSILLPPETVTLSLDQNVLHASGHATYSWIVDAAKIVRGLSGISHYDDTELSNSDLVVLNAPDSVKLSLVNGVLTATGKAPYLWILQTRDKVSRIAGITHYIDKDVANSDLESLNAPGTVTLNVIEDVLYATGSAGHLWKMQTRGKALQIAGINHYVDHELIDADLQALAAPDSVSLVVDGTTLRATGSASHEWIQTARQQAMQIPGINDFDTINLDDRELNQLHTLIGQLENEIILFDVSADVNASQKGSDMSSITELVKRILSIGSIIGYSYHIEVIGHSDSSGKRDRNYKLSAHRADNVRQQLIARGISPKSISAIGVADDEPVRLETSDEMKRMNRSVTFKVKVLPNKGQSKGMELP